MKKIKNKDFKKILQPIHKNHTERMYKKLKAKMYTLRQSLRKRSLEHDVEFDITIDEIKELFWEAYGKECKYCGRKLTLKTIAGDHKVPLSKNGPSTKQNIQLICKVCNTRKGALHERDFKILLEWLDIQSEELRNYVLRKLSKGGRY